MIEVPKFAELIEPYLLELKNDPNVKIDSYTTRNLVPIGENYGSLILAVEVKLTNGKIIPLVAKLNPCSEMFKKIFNISIAFKKEAEFYKVIVPILHKFQQECNMPKFDSFSKYYGSRYSLKSDPNAFDDDACLVMENVKHQGFTSINRSESYDLSITKYLMKEIAHFHALPIAMKLKKPKEFAVINNHLALNYADRKLTTEHAEQVMEMVKNCLQNDPELAPYTKRVLKVGEHSLENYLLYKLLGSEPFNTITHSDLWITNIMLKFDETTKQPIANRFVDYQMAAYGHPAHDITFFLHSSVKSHLILDYYDHLVDYYYDEFIKKLKEYKIETNVFSKKVFLDDLDKAAKDDQLYHILFMIVNVFLETAKPELGSEVILGENLWNIVQQESYLKHLKAVILNYIKHNWL